MGASLRDFWCPTSENQDIQSRGLPGVGNGWHWQKVTSKLDEPIQSSYPIWGPLEGLLLLGVRSEIALERAPTSFLATVSIAKGRILTSAHQHCASHVPCAQVLGPSNDPARGFRKVRFDSGLYKRKREKSHPP